MLMTDELFLELGFEKINDHRWEHKEYYEKYYLWYSTRDDMSKFIKGWTPLSLEKVVSGIVNCAKRDAINQFKNKVAELFSIENE